jgi:hypothetical protein
VVAFAPPFLIRRSASIYPGARGALALQPDVLRLFGNPPPIPPGIPVSKTEVVDDDRIRGYVMCENSQTHKKALRHAGGAGASLLTLLRAAGRPLKSALPLLCGLLTNLLRL